MNDQEKLIRKVFGGKNDKELKKLLKDESKANDLYKLASAIMKKVDEGQQMQLQTAEVQEGAGKQEDLLKIVGRLTKGDIDLSKLNIVSKPTPVKSSKSAKMLAKKEEKLMNLNKIAKEQMKQATSEPSITHLEYDAEDLDNYIRAQTLNREIMQGAVDEESLRKMGELAKINEANKIKKLLGEKEKEGFYEGKDGVYTIKNLIKPVYTQDELRHKKIYVVREARKDLSDKYKNLITQDGTPTQYKLAKVIAPGGGQRKIILCPYCENKMMASGIKTTRKREKKEMTDNQKNWNNYINTVAKMEKFKKQPRKEVLREASRLKGKGITLEELEKKGDNIYGESSSSSD